MLAVLPAGFGKKAIVNFLVGVEEKLTKETACILVARVAVVSVSFKHKRRARALNKKEQKICPMPSRVKRNGNDCYAG